MWCLCRVLMGECSFPGLLRGGDPAIAMGKVCARSYGCIFFLLLAPESMDIGGCFDIDLN